MYAKRMRRTPWLLVALVALALACERTSPAPGQSSAAPSATAATPLSPLDDVFEPLAGAFDAAKDRVRVLALLSPT